MFSHRLDNRCATSPVKDPRNANIVERQGIFRRRYDSTELFEGLGRFFLSGRRSMEVADKLVTAGVTGLINFAPTSLRVPPKVRIEEIDITTALEKLAFFGANLSEEKQ